MNRTDQRAVPGDSRNSALRRWPHPAMENNERVPLCERARLVSAIRFRLAIVLPVLVSAAGWLVAMPVQAQREDPFAVKRRALVEKFVAGAGVQNRRVLAALRETPRHQFVPSHLRDYAYVDMSLPIGESQTISSPFIVGFMTAALDPQPQDRVLEIGTGSGYQAAVLGEIVREVYTIEIVEKLGRRAKRTLDRLKYENVHVKVGDGYKGWPEHAPFDKIIVTCSPEKVPVPLVQQLAEGGLLVIPVGERFQQTMYLFRKVNGKLNPEALRPTFFVPMTGEAEDKRVSKPDIDNPTVINGGFEAPLDEEKKFMPGWYYQRQFTWETDRKAPEGQHYVTFKNEQPGRGAHALQAIAIDGRKVKVLEVSAWAKHINTQPGQTPDQLAMIAFTFYDKDRKELAAAWLGGFRGTQKDWFHSSKRMRVPLLTREAVMRIGLLGATGQISFDNVRIRRID